jgi:hypothetical protein
VNFVERVSGEALLAAIIAHENSRGPRREKIREIIPRSFKGC